MAASPLREDLVADWLEELHEVPVADLPPTALAAVIGVIDSFAGEDGFLPRPALQVRTLLAALATRYDIAVPPPPPPEGESPLVAGRQLARSAA